jgi:hypothetical protein
MFHLLVVVSAIAGHLSPTFVAPQRSAILRLGTFPVASMRRFHLDAQVGERHIERVSVIGAVADETLGQGHYESLVEGGRYEPTHVRRS